MKKSNYLYWIKNIVYLSCVLWVPAIFVWGLDNGYVEVGFGYIFLYMLIYILKPLASFIYARIFIPKGKIKWLLFVICPIISYISFLLMPDFRISMENLSDKNPYMILSYCLVASLLGLIKRKKDKEEKVLEK